MKIHLPQFIAVFWLLAQMGVQALNPTEVEGQVAVDVDRSKPVWTIMVTNHSAQKLSYEMLGTVPRGLGLEVWDIDGNSEGLRIHAEDLAKFLNVDGFPASISEIPPGKSQEFRLDRKSMSTTDDMTLAKWERAKRIGYYKCRVFFGVYASRMMSISPEPRPQDQVDMDPDETAATGLPDAGEGSKEGEPFGFRLRRMLNDKKLALVDWNRGSDKEGEYHIDYLTCEKAEFDRMAPWDGSKVLEMPMHDLVTRAHEIARQKFQQCRFAGLMINPCGDAASKRYVTFSFEEDRDEIMVQLLLNGATVKTTRLGVTKEQYAQLEEYGIPQLRESNPHD